MIFLIADFFLVNHREYSWGCEGLDGIVTQLLNQMDSSGPPALGKDKRVVGILKEN
jgi:E3 ubiquitin-protein ligase RNF115/126